MSRSASVAPEISSNNSKTSDSEDGDGGSADGSSSSSSGGEMQTDIDRHVDAEAGGAHMNAALTDMYSTPLRHGGSVAEGQPVSPPITDAAPAGEPAPAAADSTAPAAEPPAFAPAHMVASAAARALAAERERRQPRGERPAQQSRSTTTGAAVVHTAVELQAMDLSPDANGASDELDVQTPAAGQTGAASASGGKAREGRAAATSDRQVNNKKQRRRKNSEPRCALTHLPCLRTC